MLIRFSLSPTTPPTGVSKILGITIMDRIDAYTSGDPVFSKIYRAKVN